MLETLEKIVAPALAAAGCLLLLSSPAGGAENCPGTEVGALPYADSGAFPPGSDFDPTGVDFSDCGLSQTITENGPDFVVEFLSRADPDFDCTLEASAPVLAVYGPGVGLACMNPQQWLDLDCYGAQVGTTIDVFAPGGFIGPVAIVVDALGSPGATFTLQCDGVLPVELEALGVE